MKQLLTTIIATIALAADAANWYVRPSFSGTGTHNGQSWTTAWSDMSGIGWNSVQPGDTIWLAGGTYNSTIYPAKSGTAGSLIHVWRVRSTDSVASDSDWSAGYDSQVVLNTDTGVIYNNGTLGSYMEFDGRVDSGISMHVSDTTSTSYNSAIYGNAAGGCGAINHITFTHCEMKGRFNGTFVDTHNQIAAITLFDTGASYIALNYCRFHDLVDGFGTLRNCSHITYDHCLCYDNISRDANDAHQNLTLAENVTYYTVSNCEIWNWIAVGFDWYGDSGPMYVFGNLFHDPYPTGSGRAFCTDHMHSSQSGQGPFYLYNNTFANFDYLIIYQNTGGEWASGSVSENNLIVNCNGGWDMSWFSTVAANIVTATSPFVSSSNFRLKAGSAPIDAGVTIANANGNTYSVDPDGNNRGAGSAWDVGAYEYGSGSSSTNPAISVSPTSYSFGTLATNVARTNMFTISNVGGGNLVGTCSVPAGPFSIVSGATYNVASNSATIAQVRYSPQSYSDSATVTFTGGGGATVAVSGSLINPLQGTLLAQTFDGVTPPTLPSGWSSSAATYASNWVTTASSSDTSPNSAYTVGSPAATTSDLVTPWVYVPNGTATLTFTHSWNFETETSVTDDGGVLMIQTGAGGAWTEITAAGGSFSANGYNSTVSSGYINPIAGQSAWGGSSGGFVTSTVQLPDSAAGSSNRLAWRFATDSGNGGSTTAAYGSWYLDSVSVTVISNNVPTGPSISTQPAPQAVLQGANAIFSVTAAGTGPLAYQWRFNGANIAGATATSGQYILLGAQPANAGSYSVVVTNAYGTATSSNALLTVTVPPSITVPPQSLTNIQGASVLLSVTASGTAPLSYQWRHAGTNLAGYVSSAMALSPLTIANSGSYAVVVTNSAGSITSATAVVTVILPPSGLTLNTTNVVSVMGSNWSLTVSAAGSAPFAYQWQLNSSPLIGATSSSYSVTNAAGSATSGPCVVTMITPPTGPTITNQPASKVVWKGQAWTFTIGASGTVPLSYQWRFNGSALAGATISSLTTSNAGTYSAVVTNYGGSTVSSNAVLTVNPMPPFPSQLQLLGP